MAPMGYGTSLQGERRPVAAMHVSCENPLRAKRFRPSLEHPSGVLICGVSLVEVPGCDHHFWDIRRGHLAHGCPHPPPNCDECGDRAARIQHLTDRPPGQMCPHCVIQYQLELKLGIDTKDEDER